MSTSPEILHQSDPPPSKTAITVYIRSYRGSHETYIRFNARVTMWEHAIANGGYLSARPSVCLSVTLVIHA